MYWYLYYEHLQWSWLLKLPWTSSHKCWNTSCPSKTITMRSKILAITQSAKYLPIWRVATRHGVKRALALHASETLLVEAVLLGHHLLCMEHLATTPGTGLLVFLVSLNSFRILYQWRSVGDTRIAENKIQVKSAFFLSVLTSPQFLAPLLPQQSHIPLLQISCHSSLCSKSPCREHHRLAHCPGVSCRYYSWNISCGRSVFG